MISAGYDAHRADPLAQCNLESHDFGAMATAVATLATDLNAPVVACLEGGYAPEALADSVAATLRAF